MIQNLNALRSECAGSARTLAVAVAQDTEVLLAVENARKLGLAKAILVGVEEEIAALAAKNDVPLQEYTVINVEDKTEACRTAVKLVRDGKADVLMKGLVDTSVILKAVLDKEIGLRDAPVLSHVAVFEVPGMDRLLYPASAPDLAHGVAPLGCAKCRSQPPTLNAPVSAKINKTKAGSLRR